MKNYCPLIFKNLYIEKSDQTHSKLGFCCLSELSEPTDIIDPNHSFLARGRQHLLTTGELPEACNHCSEIDRNGANSPAANAAREYHKNQYYPTETKITDIQYNCDNVCNLKCIMCGSRFSSSWIEDEIKLGKPTALRVEPTKNNKLLYDIDLSDLKFIYFNGGEPFMSLDHIKFLTYINTSYNAKNIDVYYNTNGTWPATDQMINLWRNFASVNIYCSIDGIDDVFEYTRFPANWQQVSKNLHNFKQINLPNVDVKLSPTIGLHNVLYLDEFINWANNNNFKFNVGTIKGVFSLWHFPSAHYDYLIKYLSGISDEPTKNKLLDFCKTNITDTLWINYLNQLDDIRGNNWKTSLNKLYTLDSAYFDQLTLVK